MSKEVRLPYSEYRDLETTVQRQNKHLREAIAHEGNMIIDQRHIKEMSSNMGFSIPVISGKIPSELSSYKEEFDKKLKEVSELEYKYIKGCQMIESKEKALKEKLAKKDSHTGTIIATHVMYICALAILYGWLSAQ